MAFCSRINAHSVKEKRGAQCIMGGPMADWASSSITKGSFQLNLKKSGEGFSLVKVKWEQVSLESMKATSYLNPQIIKKLPLNHNYYRYNNPWLGYYLFSRI